MGGEGECFGKSVACSCGVQSVYIWTLGREALGTAVN